MGFNLTGAFDHIKAEDKLKDSTYAYLLKKMHKKYAFRSWALIVTALFLFVIGVGSGYSIYFTEVTYISVDINPSVELGLNRFDQVVSVTAFNEDGDDLITQLPLKYKNYSDAILRILDSEVLDVYLQEDSLISLTVQAQDAKKEEILLRELNRFSNRIDTPVECHSADSELHAQAHAHGMSMGKYRTFEELQSLDPSVTADNSRKLSMGELRQLINDCHDQENQESVQEEQTPEPETQEPVVQEPVTQEQRRDHHGQRGCFN